MRAACTDEDYMEMALALARRGLGRTAPNPSVGAVIVSRDGLILGRGWTQPGGRPHAETMALREAGERARGATAYVTLEPCSHHGQTPPCASALIRAGIGRLVCALRDPDERVAGRGFAMLGEAGVEVVENVLTGQAHWLTLGHILRVTENRPFVQMKIATDRHGLIAPGDGAPVWVTGEEARARGHLLRAQADAILVGIGTVLADDPSLDCRLPGMAERSPRVIVLDRKRCLPPFSRLARSPRLLAAGQGEYGGLRKLLEKLAGEGITRLLVEGGPHVWRSFVDEGLVDEIIHFKGAGEAGAGGLEPLAGRRLEEVLDGKNFIKVDSRAIGGDKMSVWRSCKALAGRAA